MNKSQIKLLLLCIAIGLLLGTFHRQLLGLLRNEDAAEAPEGLPTLFVPEEGVTSDPFSLKLFHTALNINDNGNCCVAPASVVRLLSQLQEASSGTTREQLAALGLPEPAARTELAANPTSFNALYVDDSLEFSAGHSTNNAIRMPFKRDISRALALINSWETNATANEEGHLLSGEDVSETTRLIAVASQDIQEAWALPFHKAPTLEQDFYNADGGVSATAMLFSTDSHTAAAAPDGAWQAVALFFKRAGRSGNPCCLVAIMPGHGVSARDFARTLTTEKLSEIRTALGKASPRQMSIAIPTLHPPTSSQNLQPLLLGLGLGKLFTKDADFSKLSPLLHLDLAIGRYSLRMAGQLSTPAETDAGEVLRFNKPFIWMVGDLLSPAPPLLMGLEEQR